MSIIRKRLVIMFCTASIIVNAQKALYSIGFMASIEEADIVFPIYGKWHLSGFQRQGGGLPVAEWTLASVLKKQIWRCRGRNEL
ncbi:hypothetical protein ACFFLS_19415 [Flavobacterium procerum]|uniref:Uncharacterized protein n=1 Tax=Flavobacterium procerum TaxID=1455569 RepID=A0ABV6BUW3_9FLAO